MSYIILTVLNFIKKHILISWFFCLHIENQLNSFKSRNLGISSKFTFILRWMPMHSHLYSEWISTIELINLFNFLINTIQYRITKLLHNFLIFFAFSNFSLFVPPKRKLFHFPFIQFTTLHIFAFISYSMYLNIQSCNFHFQLTDPISKILLIIMLDITAISLLLFCHSLFLHSGWSPMLINWFLSDELHVIQYNLFAYFCLPIIELLLWYKLA